MTIVCCKTSQKCKIMLAVLFTENNVKFRKKSPWAYIFHRPFLGGLYLRREICVSKSIGLAYGWKEIYVSNFQKFVLKLENSAMQVLCLYGKRKSTPRVKGELRKQPYTVTLFDCNHFHGTRNSSLANAKIYVLLYSFYFALFWIWGQFPSTSPQGLVFGGPI